LLATSPPGTRPDIEWSAPAGCPTSEVLRDQIEAYLAQSLEVERPEAFSARASVRRTENRFELELELAAGSGRTLEIHRASSCDELSKLVAIKVALTLDPEAFVSRYDAVESEAARESAPPEPESSPAPVAEVARAPGELRLFLGASGGVGAGVVPGTNGIAGVELGLGGRHWAVEARGRVYPPKAVRTPEDPSVGADILAGTATLSGCVRPELGPLRFPLWVGMEAGALRARGHGTTPERVSVRPYLATVVGLGVAYSFGRVTVFLRPEVAVTLSRPGFDLDEGHELYTVPPLAGRLMAGVDFDVWKRR
jgi:hypothetical protein